MKKFILCLGAISIALFLGSWGFTGHKTIAQIAENHLTPQAKSAVQALLGNESRADAATWADEVRNETEYKNTAPWHFINVPSGLSYEDFSAQVANSDKANVYTALSNEEKVLGDASASLDQRRIALKFVAHFVGDIHQPMHVSHAEDKGGNTIQVNFLGRGTNLHSLWDTGLLEHDEKGYTAIAAKYDHPTAAQIKKWQRDEPMIWAWESYQISSKLYDEIDAMSSRSLGEDYYQQHIGIVRQRVEQAGIRLAGVLNAILAKASVTGKVITHIGTPEHQPAGPAKVISINDAANHYNEYVSITAQVYGTKDFGSMVLVNLGAAYPNSPLTLVLRGDAKSLGQTIDGKMITVTGTITQYKNKPEIVVADPAAIHLQ